MEQEKVITYQLLRERPPLWFKLPSADSPSKRLTVKDNDNKIRAIRYCVNQDSIFVDEQDKDYATIGSIVFNNGEITAPESETSFHKFMKTTPDNEANGGSVFRMVDFEKMAADELRYFELKDAAVSALMKATESMKREMLKAYNPKAYTDAALMRMKKPQIDLDSRIALESDPGFVVEFFQGEDTGDDVIPAAFEKGLLFEKVKNGGYRDIMKAYDGEGKLITIAKTDNPVQKLREFFATDPNGAKELKILEELVANF